MKILNIIFYAVWLLIAAVLQPTVMRWIEIFGTSPNVFLIFVISAALIRGKKSGAICGLVFGLTLDMIVGRMIGVNALIFMYAGFFVGILCERFISGTGILTAAVIMLSMSLLCGIVYYIAYSMVWGDIGFWRALFRVILPEALYTGVLGLLLFVPIRKSFRIIQKRDRMRLV